MGSWREGNFCLTVSRDGIGIEDNKGGSTLTSESAGCTLDEFLAGEYHDAIPASMLPEALEEAARLAGRDSAEVRATADLKRRRGEEGIEITATGVQLFDARGEPRERASLEAFLEGSLQREVAWRLGWRELEAAVEKAREIAGVAEPTDRCDSCERLERLGLSTDNGPPPPFIRCIDSSESEVAYECTRCGARYASEEIESVNVSRRFFRRISGPRFSQR